MKRKKNIKKQKANNISVNGKKLNIKICNTSSSRALGLMFASSRVDGAFFIFDYPGTYPIHSLFVPRVFHAFYLNEKFKVVDVLLNLRPWQLYISHKGKAKYLLELFSDVGIKKIKKLNVNLPADMK